MTTARDTLRAAAAHEIFRIALEGLADRMQDSLLRAACSVVAREGMDCAAALFLPDGRVLAQASSLPLLLGGMIPAVRGILERFPAEAMQDGDGYLQNDPWSGGTHLPDIIIVRPVRVQDRTVALAATILHHQDVGGLAAGSVPPDAREIFQEGLRIPPVQWRRAGTEDAGIAAILAANSRAPDLLRGDLGAQWAAASLGAREVGGLVQSMGATAFAEASEALIAHARRMTEDALARLPDCVAIAEDALDGDGLSDAPVPLRVTLRKSGGALKPHLEIDFEGSSPQTQGPVNAAPSGLLAATFAVLRHLAPDAPANHGMLAPITLKLPDGSVVNPRFPAAVNARTATVKLACNAMLSALSRLGEPDEVIASNGGVAVVLSAGGQDDVGRNWFFTEIIASGSGGGPAGPGVAGISTDVSNARNVPVEMLEIAAPIRVETTMRRRGSGGAGLHPGGDGVRRVYRLLEGSATVSYRGERHNRGASGAQGGDDGAPSAAFVERHNGVIEKLASKARFVWNAGDRLIIETAGGGGWRALPENPNIPNQEQDMLTRRNIMRAGFKGLAGLAVLTMTFAAAQAQSWPSQNIRIVVPFPPGGSTDVLARRLAEGLRERLGQTVLVENRGGAGGTIGSEFVAKSAPDGYTLLMGVTGSHGVAPSLYPKLGYQPLRDFAPISLLVSAPLVLVVNPEVPAKTLKEFIALAKKEPDTLTYGTPGNGTSMHLTGVTFDLQAGTKLIHVPYKGSAGALTDLLSGQIKSMFGDLLVVLPQIRAGKINALAVTSRDRNPLLPDVPTMAEAGLPGFEVLSWQGLFAPAGTPPAVVERLSKEVRAVMESKDVKDFFAAQGFLVGATTPAEFTSFVGSEVKRWGEIVKAGNVKPN